MARTWYDYVSGMYEPFVSETFWPRSLQRRLLEGLSLSEDDHVLDVGCGTGLTAEVLAERAGSVDAIDLSSPQLRQTGQRDTVRFVRGDAHHLPYDDETFDAIVSVGAILYFSDPVAALAEAHRVTRPGGRLLVAGFNRPPFPTMNPVENVATIANETFFHTWNCEEARECLTAAGWQDADSDVAGPLWHPRLARIATGSRSETGTVE